MTASRLSTASLARAARASNSRTASARSVPGRESPAGAGNWRPSSPAVCTAPSRITAAARTSLSSAVCPSNGVVTIPALLHNESPALFSAIPRMRSAASGCTSLYLANASGVGRGPENMETVAVISFRFSSSGRAANSSTFRANKSASTLRCSSSGTTACSPEPLRSGDSGGVGSPFESLMRITFPEGRVRLWLCRNRPRCVACRAGAHHTRNPGGRNPRPRSPGGGRGEIVGRCPQVAKDVPIGGPRDRRRRKPAPVGRARRRNGYPELRLRGVARRLGHGAFLLVRDADLRRQPVQGGVTSHAHRRNPMNRGQDVVRVQYI